MKFEPGTRGQKVIISEDCSIKGWLGTVTKQMYDADHDQQRVYCDWTKLNGQSGGNGWISPKSLTLLGIFRQGDIIEIDGDKLMVDNEIPFDESKAILIARKQLI